MNVQKRLFIDILCIRRYASKTPNPYSILGITPNASQADIKKAYYKLCMKFHPDHNKNESAHQKMLQIQEAYDALYINGKKSENGDNNVRKPDNYYKNYPPPKQKTSRLYTGKTKYYNFDEYYRGHYGKVDYEQIKRARSEHLKHGNNFTNDAETRRRAAQEFYTQQTKQQRYNERVQYQRPEKTKKDNLLFSIIGLVVLLSIGPIIGWLEKEPKPKSK